MDKIDARREADVEKTTTNSTVYNRVRRRHLSCSFCPPNRKENANRSARTDRYKDVRKGKVG